MSRFQYQNFFFFPALLRERLSVIEVSQPESHYQFTRVGKNRIMLLNWFCNPSEKKQFDNITTTRSYLHQRSTSFNIPWLLALALLMRSCFGLVLGNEYGGSFQGWWDEVGMKIKLCFMPQQHEMSCYLYRGSIVLSRLPETGWKRSDVAIMQVWFE